MPSQSLAECPQCKGDDLEVVSERDIRPPARSAKGAAGVRRPGARIVWVRCRTCGWNGSILRKTASEPPHE